MGNELLNDEEKKDNEPVDFSNDFIRYGIISNKGEEKSYHDSYLLKPNLSVVNNSKKINFSLFGIFDGHNSDYISKSLSNNIQEFYEKEISNINKNNYKTKIEEIFKNIDKDIKERKKKEKKEDKEIESKENNNSINEIKEKENMEEEENYINIDVDKKEFQAIKEAIKNSKDIPDDLKEIDDSELENLLLFKNLFKYNNNYLCNNNNIDYMGSSASIVLVNEDNVIISNLGITKCILFNKDGNILNVKENKNLGDYKIEHTFNNPEEKKRIKKFNKSIDYNALKLNFYVPASRCFGFFKYKNNEILKEENQIISCVPDVYIYDKKYVDFILLVTKGAEPIGNSLNKIVEIIKKLGRNEIKKEEIKLSEYLNEYIKYRKEEGEKNNNKNNNTPPGSSNKQTNKFSSSIYVGKEDFGEENVIINELNNSYYKDIMELNKSSDCHGNYNATCIFIQLLQKETIIPEEDKKVNEENKKENEENNIKIEEIKKENEENINKEEENKKENEENNIKIEENKKENEEKNIKIEETKKENEENINKEEEIKKENENKNEIKEEVQNKNESEENKIKEEKNTDIKDEKIEDGKTNNKEDGINQEIKEIKNTEDNIDKNLKNE